jgi:hypothetical protein
VLKREIDILGAGRVSAVGALLKIDVEAGACVPEIGMPMPW